MIKQGILKIAKLQFTTVLNANESFSSEYCHHLQPDIQCIFASQNAWECRFTLIEETEAVPEGQQGVGGLPKAPPKHV